MQMELGILRHFYGFITHAQKLAAKQPNRVKLAAAAGQKTVITFFMISDLLFEDSGAM